ncbi:MAG: amidohydrolase [Flavobacteriaceae bacterium]|nr:amidohydrolase [Flavobacteriaceae bacterium]
MIDEFNIALIQTTLEWENPEANRNHFQKKIESIQEKVDLIILPEMFTTGFTMNAAPLAESMNGKTVIWMKQMAKLKNVAITGSIIIEENQNFYNRMVFVTPEGVIHTYDKRHLFTLANEQETYTAGNEKLIIDYKGWKICPMICYDLRFPVWARNMEDYDILLFVANWPEARIKAWDVLLQARAIENMGYCIGVNRIGTDGKGFDYVGHSGVYDGLGKSLLTDGIDKNTIYLATLSKLHLYEIRRKLRFLENKDFFKLI